MKRLVTLILLTLSLSAIAQHRHHGHHYRGHSSWGWVAPALIGGAVVYGMTRPVPQPQVIYVPQGLPPAPYGYHYEQILDANCNCYRWVLVQG